MEPSPNRMVSPFTRRVHALLPDGLLRHSILLMAATQAANVANILFQMVMGRTLSGEEFSVLATVLGLIMIVSTPLQALRTAVAHHAARLVRDGRTGDVLPLFRRWSQITLAIALPLSIFCLGGHRWIAGWFTFASPAPVFALAAVVLVIPFFPVAAGLLQGIQDFRWLSAVTSLSSLVRLGVAAALATQVSATAASGIIGHVTGVACSLALAVWVVGRHTRGRPPTGTPVRVSIPYFLRSWVVLGSLAVLMNGDIVMVRYFLLEDSDVFARAATVARSVIFIPIPIAFAMFPKVTSVGAPTPEDWRTFRRAMGYACGLIAAALLICVALPGLPIRILFGITSPTAELVRLVRIVVLAMSPLGLAYLVLHFELARHRFTMLWGCVFAAVVYVGGVALLHTSVSQVVGLLATASLLCLALLLAGLRERPGSTAAG